MDEAKLLVEQEWKNETKRLKERIKILSVTICEIGGMFSDAHGENRTLTNREFTFCYLALTTALCISDPTTPQTSLPNEIKSLVAKFEARIAASVK